MADAVQRSSPQNGGRGMEGRLDMVWHSLPPGVGNRLQFADANDRQGSHCGVESVPFGLDLHGGGVALGGRGLGGLGQGLGYGRQRGKNLSPRPGLSSSSRICG